MSGVLLRDRNSERTGYHKTLGDIYTILYTSQIFAILK